MAHEVATLHGKPDITLGIEYQRMRVASLCLGHLYLLDVAGVRIEFADVRLEIACVPDRTAGIAVRDDQIVWTRSGIEVVAVEFTGLWMQAGDVMACLAYKLNAARLIDVRVSRARIFPGHQPFANIDGL